MYKLFHVFTQDRSINSLYLAISEDVLVNHLKEDEVRLSTELDYYQVNGDSYSATRFNEELTVDIESERELPDVFELIPCLN